MTVDMNRVRAARREALGKGPEVVIGDRTFQCPPDMPFEALVAGNEAEKGDLGATYGFVRELLGDDGLEAFREWKPSLEEVKELVSGLLDEYGQKSSSSNGAGNDEGDPEASGEARG